MIIVLHIVMTHYGRHGSPSSAWTRRRAEPGAATLHLRRSRLRRKIGPARVMPMGQAEQIDVPNTGQGPRGGHADRRFREAAALPRSGGHRPVCPGLSVLSVSGHHSPCSEHRPTYEPGDDDADRHGGRLRNEEWISVAVAWPSSAAAEHGKTARRQVGHGNTDNRALQVQHVGDSYPGE